MGNNIFNIGDYVALNWSVKYKRIVKIIKRGNYNLYLLEGEKTYRLASELRKLDDYTVELMPKFGINI